MTNSFNEAVRSSIGEGLSGQDLSTMQVNVGLRCTQKCVHCHLNCGPDRTEFMEWPVMEMVAASAERAGCALVDVTGGAPEINPLFARFIEQLRARGLTVQVRSNLTVLTEPGMEKMPDFYRDCGVALVGSLPCYLEENVRAQRGPGVYEKSIEAIRRLNALGYGVDERLPLRLVYNPGGPLLPPEQSGLEADYKRELSSRFGIVFTSLICIANMPIGRFLAELQRNDSEDEYWRLLEESFNPKTIQGLMCRRQISVNWDGTLYDCDFNLALNCSVDHGAPDHIRNFDREALSTRRIVTGRHCFGCTAGQGSSCSGILT